MTPQWLIDEIKKLEGERGAGKPYWDYKQWSGPYGTKARGPDDAYDLVEGERRLRAELDPAWQNVTSKYGHLDPGTQAALVSLTYNAGPGWMNSGLGQAAAAGDLDAMRTSFAAYNKAGGQTLPGLVNRRQTELQWFGKPMGQDFGAEGLVDDPYGSEKAPLEVTVGPSGAAAPAPGPGLLDFNMANLGGSLGAFGEALGRMIPKAPPPPRVEAGRAGPPRVDLSTVLKVLEQRNQKKGLA